MADQGLHVSRARLSKKSDKVNVLITERLSTAQSFYG